jgi:WD40 repeat protein
MDRNKEINKAIELLRILVDNEQPDVFDICGEPTDPFITSYTFYCSRIKGHRGKHIAIGSDKRDIYAIWDRKDN